MQTLWGKLARKLPAAPTRLERWDTPDGDFLEIHRLDGRPGAPRLVLLHGLEGTIRSHYAQGLLHQAAREGWFADLVVFRACGPELNRGPRLYHSGETTDLAFVLDELVRAEPDTTLYAAGVSLGGNVLLKYLGETGGAVPRQLKRAVAVSVPFDLDLSSRHIQRGFARLYQWHFMRTLRRKALAKLTQFPGLADPAKVAGTKTMYEFDDVMTAPVHGFRDAADYYTRSSSIRWLSGIRIPTLLLSAYDDPFLPRGTLDRVAAIAADNPAISREFLPRGGHAGFISSSGLRLAYYSEKRVVSFLSSGE